MPPPLMWHLATVKYQSVGCGWERGQMSGERGRREPTANKSGCPWSICHSDFPLPEAGGSLKNHLPFSVAGS